MDDQKLIEAEFRGLFVGEGCIAWRRRSCGGARKTTTYCVHLSLTQRADNDRVLHWLKQHFGGNIFYTSKASDRAKGRQSSPAFTWHVATRVTVERLLRVLLEGTLPSVKQDQARAALAFLGTVKSRGMRNGYTAEQNAERAARYEAFKAMKRYSTTKCVGKVA